MASEKKAKKVQDDLKESAQKIWLAGLGALAVAEQEGVKMFDSLVERGREWEGRGKERMGEARSRVEHVVEDVEGRIDARVSAAMHRLGVPTRDEIRELTRRVEELNAKLETVGGGKPKGKGTAKGTGKGTDKAGAKA